MSYLTPERLDVARREIRAQSNEDIELKTAINWACRAVACCRTALVDERHVLVGPSCWVRQRSR